MKSIYSAQRLIDELPSIDLVIATSGYELRSVHVAKKINDRLKNAVKICCSFSCNKENSASKNNDKIFRSLGYQLFSGNGDDDFFIERVLTDITIALFDKKEVNVLIDYSSMTRLWYASVLRFFYFNEIKIPVNLYFCYSFAKFQPPSNLQVRNIHVSPIDGFSNFSIPDKPTTLIIGMGYEAERAYGLKEYFDAETFLFYNDSTLGKEYSQKVENTNYALINSIPRENVYKYPINNMEFLERTLHGLCKSLISRSRVIIAPCGPKPFTLISLLVSLRLPGVDVWRISAGSNASKLSRQETGSIAIYHVTFS
jgi:hypothetical protein